MKLNNKKVKFHLNKNKITFYIEDYSITYDYNNIIDKNYILHSQLKNKFLIDYMSYINNNKHIQQNELLISESSLNVDDFVFSNSFNKQLIMKEAEMFNLHDSKPLKSNIFDNTSNNNNSPHRPRPPTQAVTSNIITSNSNNDYNKNYNKNNTPHPPTQAVSNNNNNSSNNNNKLKNTNPLNSTMDLSEIVNVKFDIKNIFNV
ncbi:hypothetical protein CDIK_1346 [Cucumispora dikerogammari]|nr:hypothetical protein CDIK_1346 [Cucumispora dikerogammari]